MPSPRPIIEAIVWIRIEIVKKRESQAATPRASEMERTPIPSGSTAAIAPPKASRRRTSVSGRTRSSAERASAALAMRRSKFSGTSPVQPSQSFGNDGDSFVVRAAVAALRPGSSSSTGRPPASRPTMTRKPPSRPAKIVSRVSSDDSVPATPGTFLTSRTIVSRASRPSGVLGSGTPSTTRSTRSVKGERKRRCRSSCTFCACSEGMRAATSSRSSTCRARGMRKTAARTQNRMTSQGYRTTASGQRESHSRTEPGRAGSADTSDLGRARRSHHGGDHGTAPRDRR